MALKYAQTNTLYLAGSGTIIGATTIVLTSFADIYGNILTMTDFGSTGYITLEPDTTNEEAATFTGVTANANGTYTLTGAKTALAKSPYTETAGLVRSHSGGTKVVVTDNVAFWNTFANKNNTEVISQNWSIVDPVGMTDIATKQYVLSVVSGGSVSTNSLIVAGTAGETVAAGQVLYLKAADGRWWKALATASATVDTLQLGIAQGAGTAGSAITGGVLRRGLDTNQAGGAAGGLGYVKDAGGTVNTTVGTVERVVGQYLTATTFMFDPDYYYELTANQKAAMGTITVAPSSTNKFITQNELGVEGTMTIPLGESFTGATTPQPAVIINDLFQHRVSETGTANTATYMGWNTTYNRKKALRIIPRTTCTSSTMYGMVAKFGAPADNIKITIETDSANSPSGTPITNGTSNTVSGASLQTYHTQQAFTFASPFTLTAGTTYWVVFQRDGAFSDVAYYLVAGMLQGTNSGAGGGTNADYASFQGQSQNTASTWVTTNNVLPYVEIIPTTGNGLSLWQSDADATNDMLRQFMGFCTTTGSAGASGTVYTNGVVAGFSSLLSNVEYYVSTTKGTIQASGANLGMYTGYATNATTINIPANKTGVPIGYIAISSATSNNLSNTPVIKVPYNGNLVANAGTSGAGSTTGAPTITTADQSNMTTNATLFKGLANQSLTVRVRKGQYFNVTGATAQSDLILIPEFN